MRQVLSTGRLPEPRRILGWVYLGRSSLAVAIFLAAVLQWRNAAAETTLAATLLLVVTAAFTAVSAWRTHVRRSSPRRNFLVGQVAYDVLLVATVVHLTGAKESEFAPLFILVIVVAAVLLPMLGGVLIAALASAVYVADVVWSAHGLDAGVLLQLALFTVVALVTGYIGDRLRLARHELGEVEDKLHRLRLDTNDVLASIATGILTVDGRGQLAYLNPAAAELLHLPAREWLGRAVLAQLDAAAPGLGAVISRSLSTGASVRRFETEETPGGMVFGVSTTVIRRGEEDPPTVTVIFQDITERKRMDALRRRAERLESVAELSASLAHEIKNPLASIRSAVEQLTGDGVDPEDRSILGGLVVRESDRLSRLLTEFLDFARVRMHTPEQLDPQCLVDHAVGVVRAHPQAAEVALRVSIAPGDERTPILGDADLLHRAVLNLVLNGVQWAGPAGRVEVEVDTLASDLLTPGLGATDTVRIRVSDTGPGVPEEEMEHVFDPFFTRRAGGTGLGLALVQRAAEAHGGAVFVDTPRGEGWGATFTLYLPVHSPGNGAMAETDIAEGRT